MADISENKTPTKPGAPALYVFPHDLGRNTFVRKKNGQTQNTSQYYYFINFSIIEVKNGRTMSVPSSGMPQIVDVRGNKIENWKSRDLNTSEVGGDISFLQNAYNSQTTANIVLYMPDEIRTKYSASLTSDDMYMMYNYLKNGVLGGAWNTIDFLQKKVGDIATAAGYNLIGNQNTIKVFSEILAKQGEAINPITEQLFKTMQNRKFSYTFKMIPRDPEEAKTIRNIVKLFKYHMHPSVDTGEKGKGIIFKYPSLFLITYYKSGEEYEELHKIGACFLEDMDVDYTTEKGFSAFDDAQPVQTTLKLDFRETVVLTKEHIERGY